MSDTQKPYEKPQIRELGSIAKLTLVQNKTSGGSDGFTFMGQPIQNT